MSDYSSFHEKFVIKEYNFSLLNGQAKDFYVGEYKEFGFISIQMDWKDLNGNDAVVRLQQRNDPSMMWNNIPTLEKVLDTATNTKIWENFEYGGGGLNVRIEPNSTTDGIITIKVIAKK